MRHGKSLSRTIGRPLCVIRAGLCRCPRTTSNRKFRSVFSESVPSISGDVTVFTWSYSMILTGILVFYFSTMSLSSMSSTENLSSKVTSSWKALKAQTGRCEGTVRRGKSLSLVLIAHWKSPLLLSIVAVHILVTVLVRYLSLPLGMSTPQNERSPRKWLKKKLRSVFSSESPSRNLGVPDAQSTSTNVPPINNASFLAAQARENFPSDRARVIPDRTGSVNVTTSTSTLSSTL